MNIWIIDPHDAIPGEPWGYKRGMILAKTLASGGNKVTYWASNFSHATKQFRCQGWGEMHISPDIRILLVPITSYTRHISFARMKSLLVYAYKLWKRAQAESRPDCIIITIPTPFSDYIAVKLSKEYGAVLITDFRDLWPEIFATVFPKGLRWLARILLTPLYWLRRYAFQNSYAVVAVCRTYLDLAFNIAPNLKYKKSAIIYGTGVQLNEFRAMMSCNQHDPDILPKNGGEIWAIYAGTLGNNYDVITLMGAAKIIAKNQKAQHIKIIVVGDGPLRPRLTKFIEQGSLKNLVYVGVLDMPHLCRYYAKSDIGLCLYSLDSTVVIPAKAFDYYAAGLPIIHSLKGEFADYIRNKGIGIQYEAGNPKSLAAALIELASDSERRIAMRHRLHEVAPLFDIKRQYAKIFELLPQNVEQHDGN
jgi:glycosyltransferase involved in cell wall biosynthesis